MLGFSLQYEIGYSNVLTMLDLGGMPLHAEDRGADDTLVIAGGPGSQNPELLAPFIDLFVIGDGEPSLPVVCDMWAEMKGDATLSRADKLARIAGAVDWAYVPRFYDMVYAEDGTIAEIRRTRDDVPAAIKPCVIQGLDDIPLPDAPIVPFVETAHDRIAIEIMRGCPWQCRFCQSTVIKRPLRYRTVETIVNAALDSYRNTGHDEISLLSLSTSDYPKFEELVTRMSEVFTPLGVKISLPSLRITETLKKIPALLQEGRRGGLTLAPEVARDDMREQIRKPIDNQDLYEGAAEAFRRGWRKVKLYFLCGLPGERPADLDGIVEMAETIAKIGKDVTGRYRRRHRQRLQLRPQAAHALPVERDAGAGLLPLGPPLPAEADQDPVGDAQVPRHRDQPARRDPDPGRPPGCRRARRSLAPRGPARRLDRALRRQALVGDLRGPRDRRAVLQPADPAGRGGPPLGPHPRQEGTRLPGQGARPLGRPAHRDGGRRLTRRPTGDLLMAEDRWEKRTLKLTEPHGWHSSPGYNIFVADRGAVRFDIPQGWIIKPDSPSIKFHDHEPPDDDCTLALTVMHLPPGDWSGVPLGTLIEQLVRAETRPGAEWGEVVVGGRVDLDLAWIETRFADPTQGQRRARSRIALARAENIQPLITFDFWEDDVFRSVPVWDEILRSLRVAEPILDPRLGQPNRG